MPAPFSHIGIILVRPQQSGNIGAIARSISNHGLGDLYLVDPPAFDPDVARWMAPNAHQIVNKAIIVPDITTAVASYNVVFGASARSRKWQFKTEDTPILTERALSGERIAILFGPEDSGLSNTDLQYCHAMISLPTYEHAALNLSQAVNVFGAHLMQALEESSVQPRATVAPRSMTHQLHLVRSIIRLLDSSEFLDSKNPIHVHNRILQIIEKSQFANSDLAFLKTLSDKIYHYWRVNSSSKS